MNLLGFAKNTQALAKLMPSAKIYDDNIHKPHMSKEGYKLHPSSNFNAKYSSLEIPASHLPPHHPLIQQAQNLVSEYDYFAADMPYTIWISEDTSQTHTAKLLSYLFEDKNAALGGEQASPLAFLKKESPIWILQTSAQALHYTQIASPGIYVVLAMKDEDIAWHGSKEAYEEALLKPLGNMQEGEIAIVPSQYAHSDSNANIIAYDNIHDLASYFDIELSLLDPKDQTVDALLALSVEKILFNRIQYQSIKQFSSSHSKKEELTDAKGRVWQTNCLNTQSTIELLKTYSDNNAIHIILDADGSQDNLAPFFERLKQYQLLKLYIIGDNSAYLADYAQNYDIPYIECQTLHNAVRYIDKEHHVDSIAMLTLNPASNTPSNQENKLIQQLKENVSKLS